MNDDNTNFYEAQEAFEDYWSTHEIEKGKGFKQFKRWEWFMEPRVYPSGNRLQVNATWEAMSDERRLRSNNQERMAGVWSYYGNTDVPTNGGGVGRINNIRIDPNNSSVYFACAPGGGLWKTTNEGSSWTLLNTDDLASIGVSDVAIDPNNSQILYMATGDGDAGDTYSLGVLKSIDGGLTWTETGLNWNVTQTRRISRIIIDPSNTNVLLAATSNGVYRTSDAGATWSQIVTGNFKDILWKPGNTNVVYAAGNNSQFYKSSNNGASFTQITSGLPTTGVSRLALAVSIDAPNTVYVLAGNSANQGFFGFYRSTDEGNNFSTMATSPNLLGWDINGADTGGQAWYDLTVAADPNNANVVYVGGVNVWKSTDGGSTWALNAHWYGGGGAPYVHADHHGFNFVGNTSTLLIGCDGGVFKSNATGSSYTDISSNLEIAQMYRLGVSQTNTTQVISGWQDNGTNLKTGNNWSRVLGGDGFESIIDHTNGSVMYGAIYYGSISKSTNGGSGFSNIVGSNGTGVNEQGAWLTPYIMDPNDSQVLFIGKSRVYRSTNGGAAWTALGAIAGGNINALAVAPSDQNTIYTSKGASLYKTSDGNNFSALSGYPNGYITYIAVHPTNPNRVWITLSGYTDNQKVYYSADGGASWSNYSTGLPNIPANCITYANGSDDALYVGTDAGVYYRDATFSAWQAYKDGMPNVVVTELEIQYASNTLVAATYGRGLWKAPLFSLPANDGAIVSIENPTGTICATSISPSIVLGNFGENALTSATISYGVAGGSVNTFNWTGSLATGESEIINLSVFDEGTGNFTFEVQLSDVNGLGADENALNDMLTNDYFVTGGTNFLTLNLTTDCWASETSYDVVDDLGNVVFSGSGYENYTTYNIPICLADGCYTLNINDSYGDGLSGSGCTSAGTFSLVDENGVVLATMQNANFGFIESAAFCVPFVTIDGCTDPLADNYDANANNDDGSCTYSCEVVSFTLSTDCWGAETSWNLSDDLGNILFSAAAITLTSQQVFTENFCLPPGCYTMTINDSFGDGLAGIASGCAIDGNYTMSDSQGNVLFSMQTANFGAQVVESFCLSANEIPGCTDTNACNYDASATIDDGSCDLVSCAGCTDAAACNYDASATIDDGSCDLISCLGCTDATACNYDASATIDDGSCDLVSCAGCTDAAACNYDAAATIDDGSCDLISCLGCTDATACNYDATATIDDGSCDLVSCAGCTDATACNYDATATIDDGSCDLVSCAGCTDAASCNYDATATIDDGSCDFLSCVGCTDATACNYDATATIDDASCVFASNVFYADLDNDGYGDPESSATLCTLEGPYVNNALDCDDTNPDMYPNAPSTNEGIDNDCDGIVNPDEMLPCEGDMNNDGMRDISDLLMMLQSYGCSDCSVGDLNNSGSVESADILIFLGFFGTPCQN